jgi:hypothetical protein
MALSRESLQERRRSPHCGLLCGRTQAWFRCINATFAVSCVTKPLTSSTGRTPSCPRRWSTPLARSATIPAPLPSYSVKCCPHMDSATTRGLLNGWTPLASGRTSHQPISPDGPTQRPEASLGGREGPVPPQDAPPHPGHGQPVRFP